MKIIRFKFNFFFLISINNMNNLITDLYVYKYIFFFSTKIYKYNKVYKIDIIY